MKTGEWTLRSRRVVTPSGLRAADVVIRNEAIAEVADYEGPESEGVILDAGDLVVMPGLVLLHKGGPGRSDLRAFETATRDAAAGGATTLVDLPPDHDPGTNSPSAFRERMAAVEGKIRVDCGLVVGLGRGNADLIESWIEAGVMGVEADLDATEADLRGAMPILAGLGRPLLVHPDRAGRETASTGSSDRAGSTLPDRDFDTFRLLIRLCRETRCWVHLIHPNSIEALPMIAQARAEGLPLTVETCPDHLGLAPEEIRGGGPTSTPGRSPDLRERLWDGLRSGLIDGVGSGHPRAFTPSTSPGPEELRPTGRDLTSPGLALPALWAEAERRGFSMEDLARWTASNAARAFGLSARKGSILAGLDADFVVFAPELREEALPGQVEATVLRGTLIYQAGQFFEHPKGAVVLRVEETQPIQGTKAR